MEITETKPRYSATFTSQEVRQALCDYIQKLQKDDLLDIYHLGPPTRSKDITEMTLVGRRPLNVVENKVSVDHSDFWRHIAVDISCEATMIEITW